MTSVKLKLNKDRQSESGFYPLVFQVIHRRRKKLIYTSFKLQEQDFDAVKEKILYRSGCFSRVEIRRMNHRITKEGAKIRSLIENLERRQPDFTADDFLNCYYERREDDLLFTFINSCIHRKLMQGKEGTAAAYTSTRSSLQRFVGGESLRLKDVTAFFVKDYESFLLNSGVCRNTVSYYIRNLRAIYNQAVNGGTLVSDGKPFQHVQTSPAKTVKRAMSRDYTRQFARIALMHDPKLEFVRDLFMFSFYARGMSFVDIVFLKKENVRNGVIEYFRHKTHQCIRIAITDKLRQIMELYANESSYVFPVIDEQSDMSPYRQYRTALGNAVRRLKRISRMMGMDVPLTTYVARHSWATQAKECGAPVSVISEGLGHTSEKTTRIYLKEFDQSVLDQVNDLVSDLE